MSDRSDLLSSLVTFHVRLWLSGLVLAVLVPVSLGAAVLNLLGGHGPESGPYGDVHRRAKALDVWLKRVGEAAPRRSYRADAPDVRDSASARRVGESA